MKLVVVRPAGVTGMLPVFMFFHGGGWVLGDCPTHERLVRDLVAGSGATAAFVEYDRSPEAHYPVAIIDAYKILRSLIPDQAPMQPTSWDIAPSSSRVRLLAC